jgi:hypothetical protein
MVCAGPAIEAAALVVSTWGGRSRQPLCNSSSEQEYRAGSARRCCCISWALLDGCRRADSDCPIVPLGRCR